MVSDALLGALCFERWHSWGGWWGFLVMNDENIVAGSTEFHEEEKSCVYDIYRGFLFFCGRKKGNLMSDARM